jgi:rhodanese-related sulfurtransferase
LATLRTVEVPAEDLAVTNLNRPADVRRFLARSSGVGTLRPPDPGEDRPMDVPEIDVDELASRLDAQGVLIDVREPNEYADVRVPGSTLIPLGTIPERLAEIPSTGAVHLICRSGGRSAKAVAFLREQGIDAVNVAGGTLAWVESGREVDHG